MYGTIRRATRTHFDPESRLCPHSGCPEYERNYCNCFIKVPAHWNECEFTTWMTDNISAVRHEYGGVHMSENDGRSDNDDKNELVFKAGDLTEDLISYIADELAKQDVNMLDEVEIGRELHRPDALAGEPITIAVLLVCGTTAATIEVGRIVERWLENRRQREQIKLTIEAFKLSDKAGEAVAGIAEKNADTELTKLPEPPDYTKFTMAGGAPTG
jgi:hypothetical protein